MTRTEITAFMVDVVEEKMRRFQTDFYDYDKPRVEECAAKEFPFLWIVSELHTYMISLGSYEEDFFNNFSTRNAYADGNDGISFYLESPTLHTTDRLFLITEDKIWEVDVNQARAAVKDYTIPAYEKWKELNGELIKTYVKIKFEFISFGELRKLIQDCDNHGDDSLLSIFKRFKQRRAVAEDHKIIIGYNPYANEFSYKEYYNGDTRLVGGIVFHGWPETGYQQNGSVQLVPQYGWASHS